MQYVLNKCLVSDGKGNLGLSWHSEKPTGDFKKFQSNIYSLRLNEKYNLDKDSKFKVVIYLNDESEQKNAQIEVAKKVHDSFNFFDDGFELVENSQHKNLILT